MTDFHSFLEYDFTWSEKRFASKVWNLTPFFEMRLHCLEWFSLQNNEILLQRNKISFSHKVCHSCSRVKIFSLFFKSLIFSLLKRDFTPKDLQSNKIRHAHIEYKTIFLWNLWNNRYFFFCSRSLLCNNVYNVLCRNKALPFL